LPGEDTVLSLLSACCNSDQIVMRRTEGRNDLPKPTTQFKAG